MENQYLIREVFEMLSANGHSLGKNLVKEKRDSFQISKNIDVESLQEYDIKAKTHLKDFANRTQLISADCDGQKELMSLFARVFPNKIKRDSSTEDISKILRDNIRVGERISIEKLYQKVFQNILQLCFSEDEKMEMSWAKEKSLTTQILNNSTVASKISYVAFDGKAILTTWLSVSLFSDPWNESIARGLVTPAMFIFHDPFFTDYQSHSTNKIEVQCTGHSEGFMVHIDPNLLEEQTALDISIQTQRIIDDVLKKVSKTERHFYNMLYLKSRLESADHTY